jgi:hypothetical protein
MMRITHTTLYRKLKRYKIAIRAGSGSDVANPQAAPQ